jgi:flagellin-like protein
MKGQQAIGTLVIFIALVITAALAAFVLVSTTNALQSKSIAVANKTMEKSTMGFASRSVEGWADTGTDGQLDLLTFGIELAPGSGTIDLDDVTVIYQAASGTVYGEYSVKNYNDSDATTYAELNSNKLDGTGDDVLQVNGAAISDTTTAYVVKNRSSFKHADRYVEAGELYVLGMKLPQALQEGQDWQITVRAPYTQDLVISGYAPDVIQNGTRVNLK